MDNFNFIPNSLYAHIGEHKSLMQPLKDHVDHLPGSMC